VSAIFVRILQHLRRRAELGQEQEPPRRRALLALHAIALQRQRRRLREHLHEPALVRHRLAPLEKVRPERPQHRAARRADRHRPRRHEALRERQVRELGPPVASRDVRRDDRLAARGRRAAGPQVGRDRQAVDLGVVRVGQARRRADAKVLAVGVDEQDLRAHLRVGHRLDEPAQRREHLSQRLATHDLLEDSGLPAE